MPSRECSPAPSAGVWALRSWRSGRLVAAMIAWRVLPPLPRAAPQGSGWPPALGPIFRNRRALLYVWAYGLHNGEVSAIRTWLVALLVFAADRAGRRDLSGYATLVATVANLCGTPFIIAVSELATKRDRRSVIAITMAVSAAAGLLLAAAAAWSPIAAAFAAILCVAAATADAGTINAGLVAASEAKRRGSFLAVQALSGFGGLCRDADAVRIRSRPCREQRARGRLDHRFRDAGSPRRVLAARLPLGPCQSRTSGPAATGLNRLPFAAGRVVPTGGAKIARCLAPNSAERGSRSRGAR